VKLSALKVAKAGAGMHGDGDGLWLFVNANKDDSLSKRFVFRYRRHGKYSEIPLGPFPAVGLADARLKRDRYKADLAAGIDPAEQRRVTIAAAKAAAQGEKRPPLTFKVAVQQYGDIKAKTWRSLKAARAFSASMERHVLDVIGAKPITDITHADVLAVFDPLYDRLAALTASQLRSSCEAVFNYAKSRHRLTLENPFAWRGNLAGVYGHVKPTIEHFKTIDYRNVPLLFQQLMALGDDPAALAARLQIALALRPTEARTLRFDYVDTANGTIVLSLTKNGKPFTTPLNEAAAVVIDRCQQLRSCDYLFVGRDGKSPIGERAIYNLVSKLTHGASCHATARSTFADYAYDHLPQFSDSTIEAALNHAVGDATVRAYRRGNALGQRRLLMQAWSEFILGRVALSAAVIPFAKVVTA
jgi:integrase